MGEFGDPSVEAFIQRFRQQLSDDAAWEAVVREMGLPPEFGVPGASASGGARAVPSSEPSAMPRRPAMSGGFAGLPPRPVIVLPAARPGLRCLTVRIDVDDVEPAVWRRVRVRSDVTMEEFHGVIQAVVGWSDEHLHRFALGPEKDVWGGPCLASRWDVEEGDEFDECSGAETDVMLDQVLREAGEQLFYVYDFGDDWVHTITLEQVAEAPVDADLPSALCLAGENAAPLENAGGPWSYNELVQQHRTMTLPRELAEWVPPGWDPSHFCVDEANVALDLVGRDPLAVLEELAAGAEVDPQSALGEVVAMARPDTRAALLGAASAARQMHKEPTDGERRAALLPWSTLLGMLAEGPLPLTQAGYLKPAVVAQIVDELGLRTFGTSRREMDVEAVTALRESLKAMGYARHYRGELVVTKRGLAAAARVASDELVGMWRDLAATLAPAKASPFERCARTVLALLVAAGCPRDEAYDTVATTVAELGWRLPDGTTLDGWELYQVLAGSTGVFNHVDASWIARHADREYSSVARALAFDAVLG